MVGSDANFVCSESSDDYGDDADGGVVDIMMVVMIGDDNSGADTNIGDGGDGGNGKSKVDCSEDTAVDDGNSNDDGGNNTNGDTGGGDDNNGDDNDRSDEDKNNGDGDDADDSRNDGDAKCDGEMVMVIKVVWWCWRQRW